MLKIEQDSEPALVIHQDVRQVHVQVRHGWAHVWRHVVGQPAQQANSGLNQRQRCLVQTPIGVTQPRGSPRDHRTPRGRTHTKPADSITEATDRNLMQPSQRRSGIAHQRKRPIGIHRGQRFFGIHARQVLEHRQRLPTHGRAGVSEGQHRRDENAVLPDPPMLGEPFHEPVARTAKQHLADQPASRRLQHPRHMASATAKGTNGANRSGFRQHLRHTRCDILNGKLRDRHDTQP